MDKKEIVSELGQIVDRFNSDFLKWSGRHGCVANFGWVHKYETGHNGPVKLMQINDIDMIIYRTPPPTAKAFEGKLGELTKGV